MDYITIASMGDAADFGDLSASSHGGPSNINSSTRGIFGQVGPTHSNVIEYITIGSTGDTTDFGDLSDTGKYCGGTSNSTRGIFASVNSSPDTTNIIEYITIASTGNSTDFGD